MRRKYSKPFAKSGRLETSLFLFLLFLFWNAFIFYHSCHFMSIFLRQRGLIRSFLSISTSRITPGCVAPWNRQDDTPFLVVRSVDNFPYRHGVQRLATMRHPMDAEWIHDVWHGHERDTAVGAWKKRWGHCSSRGVLHLHWFFPNMDSLCFLCFEEGAYKRHLGDIVANIKNIEEACWSYVSDKFVAILHRYDWF